MTYIKIYKIDGEKDFMVWLSIKGVDDTKIIEDLLDRSYEKLKPHAKGEEKKMQTPPPKTLKNKPYWIVDESSRMPPFLYQFEEREYPEERWDWAVFENADEAKQYSQLLSEQEQGEK